MNVAGFLFGARAEFLTLLMQHVLPRRRSTLAAIGDRRAVRRARRPPSRLGAPVVWIANVVQTILSLAMFGLLPPPLVGGLGARVAILVLIRIACCAGHPHHHRRHPRRRREAVEAGTAL